MLKENGCSRINGRCAKINDQGEKGWKKQIQVTQHIVYKALVSGVDGEGYEANAMSFMPEWLQKRIRFYGADEAAPDPLIRIVSF